MNILDRIMKDHEKQRTMLKELVETEALERREVFGSVRAELLRNADAEETWLYDPLSEKTKADTHNVMEAHNQINEIIEQLDDTDLASPRWIDYAHLLREQVLMHLDEEEDDIFRLASRYMSDEELENLGLNFAKSKA